MKKSYSLPSSSEILANLSNRATIGQDGELTNHRLAFDRKEWMKGAILKNRLTDFFKNLEQAILALPAGKVEKIVKDKTTGVEKIGKAKNHRDEAKDAFTTAFRNAVKELPEGHELTNKKLAWKLSVPIVENVVKVEKTLSDRILSLLGETIDGQGLANILGTIDREQERFKLDLTSQALDLEFDALRNDYLTEVAHFLKRGKTEEKAVELAKDTTGFVPFDVDVTREEIANIAATVIGETHLVGMARRAMNS